MPRIEGRRIPTTCAHRINFDNILSIDALPKSPPEANTRHSSCYHGICGFVVESVIRHVSHREGTVDDTRQAYDLKVSAIMPGGIFFYAPFPSGVPLVDTLRSRHIWAVQDSAAFASLDADERTAVLTSLIKSVERAEYHFQRFCDLRATLDERRRASPGEVFFDTLATCVHFELQAFCGATRLIVDELIYIAARRHGASQSAATRSPWSASDLILPSTHSMAESVPELRRLRHRRDWYDTLNTYRNAFFHHGWRHGSGHADPSVLSELARAPSRNALLVPDKDSIRSRSKPFNWTWTQGTTIDDVVKIVREGLVGLVQELCLEDWCTPEPAPGNIPIAEQPNLLVTLAKPIGILSGKRFIVPIFVDKSYAESFQPFCADSGFELVTVPAARAVVGARAITFSLAGLEDSTVSREATTIEVFLNPRPTDQSWLQVMALARSEIAVKDLIERGTIHPISVPVSGDIECGFVWQQRRKLTEWNVG